MVYVCQLLHSEHMHTNVPQSVYVHTFVVDQNKGDLCEPNELYTASHTKPMYIRMYVQNLEQQEQAYILVSKCGMCIKNNESLGIALAKFAYSNI